ncbi:histidine phosphatase family protein [Modicisalibacter radicis]
MPLRRSPFIFLRHGETECNARGVIAGRTDSPLTETGRNQARMAAERLRHQTWGRVVCGSLSRTLDTAMLAVPGSEPLVTPGLNERDWGELEGRPLARLVSYTDTPPGGEPWAPFERRVTKALNDILDEWDTPLVVAHSGVYRVICRHLFGRPDGPRIANAEPVVIRPGVSGWQLTALACSPRLRPAPPAGDPASSSAPPTVSRRKRPTSGR